MSAARLAAAAVLLGACSGPRPAPPTPTPAAASASASAAPIPPPAPTAEVLVAGTVAELPAYLQVARGAGRGWLVHDVPDAEETILAPLHEDGVGAPRRAAGRLAAVAAQGDRDWFVWRVGGRLCLESAEGTRSCHAPPPEGAPKAAVALPDGVVTVDAARRVVEEGRGPSKQRVGAAPVDRDPVEMVVRVQRYDAAGKRRGEPVDTGLRFNRPLEGMDLVDAVGTDAGAALLYYEEAKPRREGRREIAQARLRSALLDREGSLVEGSEKTLYEGDRRFGYVEGFHRPRLFGEGRALAVARFVDEDGGTVTSGWRGWSVSEGRALAGPGAWFGLRPSVLLAPPDDALRERLADLWRHAPRLLPGQPGSDAGRVAWVGSRGWFLLDGALHHVDPTHAEPSAHPGLEVRRATVAWAHLAPDGRGWALTHEGLLLPDGSLVPSTLPNNRDAYLGRPVEVGGAPWLVRRSEGPGGAEVVGHDGTAGPPLVVGEHALVGGDEGMLLTRDGARLAVSTWSGAEATVVATVPTPVRGWFTAVAHEAGALLVGEPRVGEPLVAVVVGRDGAQGPPRPLAARAPAPAQRRDALHPLPGGGALLVTHDGWRWLGADGAVVGEAAAGAPPVPCSGGWRPMQVATGLPGETLPWPADLCLAGAPAPLTDGRVAAFAVRRAGPHEDVVRVVLGAAGPEAEAQSSPPPPSEAAPAPPKRRCPPDMVDIAGAFCIDRFEAYLTDGAGQPLSPHYPPTPGILAPIFKAWALGRFYEGDLLAQGWPLPPLTRPPASTPTYVARNALGATPSSYLSGYAAEKACEAAGKRLCSHAEWERACKGERQTKFPYGDDYEQGRCNVFRFTHPARVLHGNPSVGHLDPRLNLLGDDEGPLRTASGDRPRCASRWGDDAIYDMVGNLDEWFGGRGDSGFAGGFYARSTRQGCEAVITVHPRRYLDYSLGVRCCAGTSP